jgi:hypothetical protein
MAGKQTRPVNKREQKYAESHRKPKGQNTAELRENDRADALGFVVLIHVAKEFVEIKPGVLSFTILLVQQACISTTMKFHLFQDVFSGQPFS